MSDDKKATLKKVLLAAMSAGALGSLTGHVAHAGALTQEAALAPAGANGSPGNPPTPVEAPGGVQTNDVIFVDAFVNSYVQRFGNLFVEGGFLEVQNW